MDPQNPYAQQNPYQQQQQQQYNPYAQRGFGMPFPSVPNATAIMILGICSIVFCGLGPILGTIALVLSKSATREFEAKPGVYDPGSISNVRTGRICGIIGLCIGIVSWIAYAAYLIWWWYLMRSAMEAIEMNSHY